MRLPRHSPHALLALLGLAFLLGVFPVIGEDLPAGNPLSLDRIFTEQEFKTKDWGPARWLKNGRGYTTLETSATLQDAKDIVHYDPESGYRTVWVQANDLIPNGKEDPFQIADYSWSDNTAKVLLFTNTQRVWRQETRGDYYVFDRLQKRLVQLGPPAVSASLMFATFSPDATRVAFVRENNLYVQRLDNLRITALTRDGSSTCINGTSDWVYEEEFYLRRAFRWSPDSSQIAYWQFDTSEIPEFTLINNTEQLYPTLTEFPYPKVGTTNAAWRIGIVKATGGRTRWLQPHPDSRNHYLPEMEWAPDSRSVVCQQLNRLQNTNQLIRGTARTRRTEVLFTDSDAAWVDPVREWHWIDHGQRFLWLSERDGWRHLYAVDAARHPAELLTPGDFDVISIVGLDTASDSVYFIASPDNPTQRYLYRASLPSPTTVERVTPQDQAGTHGYELSDDGRWAFHTFSRFGQPPATDLIQLPSHRVVRALADNSELKAKLEQLAPCPVEFFRVGLSNNVQLDAWGLKPPNFDPAHSYPLVLHVYGEPAGQTVLDRWGGNTYLWHRYLAEQGYVVISVDNRGTAAPRGREWRKCIYRQVGLLASADQAEAARALLAARPYLDPARVGIWGWSGGGSMSLNAIFRYPELYRTALAIAFISDQRLYDTIYQERYMGLPQDNDEGYREGSPITYAHQLQGNLLLVYGTGDDNCHYQNCEKLIDELVRHNKVFSLMSYPNRTHSLREGENTQRHLYETLTRYLIDHLPTESPTPPASSPGS